MDLGCDSVCCASVVPEDVDEVDPTKTESLPSNVFAKQTLGSSGRRSWKAGCQDRGRETVWQERNGPACASGPAPTPPSGVCFPFRLGLRLRLQSLHVNYAAAIVRAWKTLRLLFASIG